MNEWLARARAAWDGLSQRERILLGAAGGTAVFVLAFFLVIQPLLSLAQSNSSGIAAAEMELQTMKRLRRDFAEVTGQLDAVERRIKAKGQNSNVVTLLESLASTSGVKVERIEKRQSQSNDRYAETRVEVELESVNLTQTVNYLHNIESSPQLLSVKSLRLKRRNDKTALLDVTFAVSSFEPL